MQGTRNRHKKAKLTQSLKIYREDYFAQKLIVIIIIIIIIIINIIISIILK